MGVDRRDGASDPSFPGFPSVLFSLRTPALSSSLAATMGLGVLEDDKLEQVPGEFDNDGRCNHD